MVTGDTLEQTDEGRRPQAASVARDAAQKARELADFLDEYADHLDAPDHAELVAELAEAVTTRTHALRKAVRQARESGE
jgi:LPS O-antigen subunit length determinant protein (WzzB/FepE family)